MDEPAEHYAKGNNPDRKRQILHGKTYMWNLKKSQIHRNTVEKWFHWLEDEANRERIIKGYKLSVIG